MSAHPYRKAAFTVTLTDAGYTDAASCASAIWIALVRRESVAASLLV